MDSSISLSAKNKLIGFSKKLEKYDLYAYYYIKVLSVKRYESGLVEGYKVLVIYEVERYLNGENPMSTKEEFYSASSLPSNFEEMVKILES